MDSKKTHTNLFRRYLARHITFAVSILVLCVYYLLREVRAVADFATTHIAQSWHGISGRIFSVFPFSVAEWLCALAVIILLAYLVVTVYKVIQKPEKLKRLYGALVTIFAGVLSAYALLCWLWGIGFYSSSYTELSGIETEALCVEELKEVAIYFALAANAAGELVDRDEDGVFICDTREILSEAPTLFYELPTRFDFLSGPEFRPKPLFFSYLMSHMNFTGLFFPFTGEANVNVHAPDLFLPSTVVHELTHQRGVFREQDANFTAVLVCMEGGNADFAYSGALLAYVYLSNAIWQVSYEDWVEVDAHLGENVQRDLYANSAYWAEFQTPAAQISEAAYEEFLHNQGQTLGMRSYGACIDLLVAYYGKAAKSR